MTRIKKTAECNGCKNLAMDGNRRACLADKCPMLCRDERLKKMRNGEGGRDAADFSDFSHNPRDAQ